MTTATDYRTLTGDYVIDPAHSRFGFVARHAMVTKVRGAFNEFEGSARVDGENPANSSAELTIKAASIDTRNADRDEHLRSNDFLAMAEHPEITFRSTEITHTGEDTFDVTGELTVRGVTRSVTIPLSFEGQAVDPFGNSRIGFEGSTTINRRDFGVTWNAALETGGVLVSDKVVLEFEISAVKQN
ncbi:polyisoprenoid-binding protein YceI [Saccharomonospora amisosensis]|uniref:Polyisoprenoid-binding protein YceI n=1 Tax=Saccharomonospora amisosensis TaxID=1128677 RepID=A0A7X5ZQ64_9PSEU|nr:YceI family protein [Saccharomonospora amisosensis]NIJ11469.1 polyisoprenoid-binding protein YceI [Saccharomonospora amisosensis]